MAASPLCHLLQIAVIFVAALGITTHAQEEEGAGALEATPHTLNIITDRVVVHTSSAVVFSHGELELDPGPHLILLRNLSTPLSWNETLEETSLQVNLEGGGALVERIVWLDVPLATKEELKALKDEIDRVDADRKRLSDKISLSDSYMATLHNFGVNLVNPSAELVKKGGSIIKILKDAHEARVEMDESIHSMKQQQIGLNAKWKKLRANFEQASQPHRVAKVYISVEKTHIVTFHLQRVVASVSWRPHYEIYFNSSTGLVTLMYHALVHQETGHPWSNVSMELCTGAPSTDRSVPSLSPWFVHSSSNPGHRQEHEHNKKRKVSNAMYNNMQYRKESGQYRSSSASMERTLESDGDAAGQDDDEDDSVGGSFEPSEVVSSGVSDVFVLPKRQTIPSSHDIRVHITTITLKANLTYTAVPKRSTKVYVQAAIINNSPFTLLPGSSLVFFDGSFVGSSTVNLIPTNGLAFLDAGIDNALSVMKKVISDETTSSGGVFSSTRTKEVHYELVLKSMRSFGVTVRVKDQVPLPQSEDLKVHVSEPRIGELRADHKRVKIDSNTTLRTGGEVVWERHLSPDSVLKIPLRFTIEVDAGRHIRNFEL